MGQTKEMRLSTDARLLFKSSPRENKFGRSDFLLVIHFVIMLLPQIYEPIEIFFGDLYLFFNLLKTSWKLPNTLSKFSAISSANTSGSGRLSKSASDLSFSQAISKDVLSRATISS